MSHPVRGAWIEIRKVIADVIAVIPSHPVRGAWIEIPYVGFEDNVEGCRTPSGVRGLKY